MKPKICYLKIDVWCEASVNFHHMSQLSQYATPATLATLATQFAHVIGKNTQHETIEVSKCCETSKSDHFSSSRYRRGRLPQLPTVANMRAASREHVPTPRPPK